MHFIVAGVGYTGRRVVSLLPAGQVIGVSRSPVDDHGCKTRLLEIDLDKEVREPAPLPSPCTILYTIPPARLPGSDPRLPAFLSSLTADVDRIVYLSTTGVYGNRDGQSVSECDPPAPVTDRAIRRLAAESLLEEWCLKRNTGLFVFRVPGIYGPGRLGLDRINAGRPLIRESEANPGSRIHVDDLAACCVIAMTQPVPPGVFNIGDGNYRSSTWFTQTVAELAGLDPLPEIARTEAQATMSEARLSFLNESRKIDTTKMRQVLGFTPTYTDPAEGIKASLAG